MTQQAVTVLVPEDPAADEKPAEPGARVTVRPEPFGALLDHFGHRGPVRARVTAGRPVRTGPARVIIGSRPSPASLPSPAAPPTRACDANPLAGFGSEAGKDQHYVLDAPHTMKGMTAQ
jgi:hypothetical protein